MEELQMENKVETRMVTKNDLGAGNYVYIPKLKKVAIVTSIFREGVKPIMCCDIAAASVGEIISINVIEAGANDVILGIPASDFELCASHVYALGDKVASKMGGGFIGMVTGFEPATNRVVCISAKIRLGSDNRTRYAYKLDEIESYIEPEKTYVFNRGTVYLINDVVRVYCAEDPADTDRRILYKLGTGEIISRVAKGPNKESDLAKIGIHNADRVYNADTL